MAFIDSDNPLAAEILQEAAEAYFAACTRMVDAIEALKAFDRVVAASTQRSTRVERRARLLDEAAERVHFVLIQRDAMKLSWSETFFEQYGIPNEVRARVGKPRRK